MYRILLLIALLVLGPERLPKVAMKFGNWAGQARRMARQLSTQIRSELDDLDVNKPFTSHSSDSAARPAPQYSRPGVDDLDPSGEPDAKPATEDQPAEPKA